MRRSVRDTTLGGSRMKSSRNVAACLLTACLALGALALPASADYGGALPTFKNLFKQAVQKVRANPKLKRAVMLEADGLTKNHRCVKHARGILRVRFVFDNHSTPNSPFASADVSYWPPPKL